MLSAITPAAARIQASPRLAYFIFSFIFSAGKLRPDNRLFHLRPSGGSAGFPNSRVCKYFTLMLSVLRFSLNNKSCSRRVQAGTGPCCDCSVFGGSEEQVHGTWVFNIVSFGFDFTLHMRLLTGTQSVVKEGDVPKISCFGGWFCCCQVLLSVTLENGSWLNTDNALASAVIHHGVAWSVFHFLREPSVIQPGRTRNILLVVFAKRETNVPTQSDTED